MELPFAVDPSSAGGDGSSNNRNVPTTAAATTTTSASEALQQSETSSLVTASSQGSFLNASGVLENDDTTMQHHGLHINSPGPLPPNTPQDVVLPSRGQLVVRNNNKHPVQEQGGQQQPPPPPPEVDFTYVDVTADDETDIFLEGEVEQAMMGLLPTTTMEQQEQQQPRADVLAVLLSGMQQNESDALLHQTEAANEAAFCASEAKRSGDLVLALDFHTQAAKSYKDIALVIRDRNRKSLEFSSCFIILCFFVSFDPRYSQSMHCLNVSKHRFPGKFSPAP